MTKSELKTGMMVKCRNNRIYLVLGNIITSEDGFNYLRDYGDDLKFDFLDDDFREFDIVEVRNPNFNIIYGNVRSSIDDLFENYESYPILWAEVTRMTIDEIKDKLGVKGKLEIIS